MTDIETSMFAGANFKSFRQHLTCHKQELWMHKGELYNSKQHDTFFEMYFLHVQNSDERYYATLFHMKALETIDIFSICRMHVGTLF
jgi:hypothetical protein